MRNAAYSAGRKFKDYRVVRDSYCDQWRINHNVGYDNKRSSSMPRCPKCKEELNQGVMIAFKKYCAKCYDNLVLLLAYFANYTLSLPFNFFLQGFLVFPVDLLLLLPPIVPINVFPIAAKYNKKIPTAKIALTSIVFGLIFDVISVPEIWCSRIGSCMDSVHSTLDLGHGRHPRVVRMALSNL
jgi:hypothetical protein